MAASGKTLDPEKRSLVDDAYAALKAAILDSSFAPGFQASEQEIALRLGMSRTPVHEAVIRLQEDGLVQVLSRRGVIIRALKPEDMREIYEVMLAMEPQAAAMIAAFPQAERSAVADQLDVQTNEMEAAALAEDAAGWALADNAFHRALIELCGNGRLARIMQTVADQAHRARMLTLRMRSDLALSVADHRRIVDAIRNGDPEAALAATRAHRLRARDILLPLIESLGLKHL